MQKKLLIIPVLLMGLAGVAGVYSIASADDAIGSSYSMIIQKIAQKFDLNQDEVQAVFQEVRAEQMAQKQANKQTQLEEKLQQAIDNGKITAEQKSLILAKQQEIQTKIQEMQTLSVEERRMATKSLQEEVKTWVNDNGINFPFLMMGGIKGMGRGGMGMVGGFHGDCPFANEATPSE